MRRFAHWLRDAALAGDTDALAAVADAPDARANHPTPEHLFPFHVAYGAGGGKATMLHQAFAYGILALDAYGFARSP